VTADGPKSRDQDDNSARRSGGERLYRGAVRTFSLTFVLVGIVVLVRTATHGGAGPGSLGILLGISFLAVGIGRLWVATRMER
jgi:hypothetical protein